MASRAEFDRRIAAVRRFNRFYTRRIGLLRRDMYDSALSLAEARVLYELANRTDVTASRLGRDLGMDAGYLSRILAGFVRRGYVARTNSAADGRQKLLGLTAKGRLAFRRIDRRSHDEIGTLLAHVAPADQDGLVHAMGTIEAVLGGEQMPAPPITLRRHRPGDMGWVIHRHAALYAREYGWDERFEAMVAGIAAKFIENFDPKCERAWIAERSGAIVGSVFVVRQSKNVAKLRMLLVEPSARGTGLGGRLVDECIEFARATGYRRLVLWTNSILTAARHIYVARDFRLVGSERHRSFGHKLVGEYWELKL